MHDCRGNELTTMKKAPCRIDHYGLYIGIIDNVICRSSPLMNILIYLVNRDKYFKLNFQYLLCSINLILGYRFYSCMYILYYFNTNCFIYSFNRL